MNNNDVRVPRQIKEDSRPYWQQRSDAGWKALREDVTNILSKKSKGGQPIEIHLHYFDALKIILVVSPVGLVIFGTIKLLRWMATL